MSRNDTVLVQVQVIRELDQAWLVEQGDGESRVAIPMSQVRDEGDTPEEGTECSIAIPRWLAEDRELEFDEV